MKYRKLSTNGPQVSAVGLGCMGMSHGYGTPADKNEMKKLLAEAVDMGYSLFDTAEIYGTPEDPHANELLVGEALAPFRDKIIIATKFGLTFDNPDSDGPHDLIPDSSPQTIRKSIEGSLRRLKTDHVDLYYQHRIDPSVEPEIVADTMASLIKEGKILYWGISETSEEYLRRAHKVCPVTAVQNRYSMMARWNENLFPVLEELGVGFVAFSPLANGLLSGSYNSSSTFDKHSDYRASMPQFSKESFNQNRELMQFINELAEQKQATPSQISLAWMLCKRPWIVPIPGTRNLGRLKENLDSSDIIITAEEENKIDQSLDSMKMSEVFGGSNIKKKSAGI